MDLNENKPFMLTYSPVPVPFWPHTEQPVKRVQYFLHAHRHQSNAFVMETRKRETPLIYHPVLIVIELFFATFTKCK